ncbi:hypothetical protein D3C85_1406190 [compost metagenome]
MPKQRHHRLKGGHMVFFNGAGGEFQSGLKQRLKQGNTVWAVNLGVVLFEILKVAVVVEY